MKNVKTMVKVGVLAAISAILMLFTIPLWFAPSFYKIDLSEVAVLIGGLAMGPIAGVFIELIKILLNFAMSGTQTGGIGELSNFIIGCAMVVPTALMYRWKRTFKGALIALSVGVISMTIIGSAVNYFIILPVYGATIMPMEAIINAGNFVNHNIVDLGTFVMYAVVPFNLVKGVAVSAMTMLLYKRLSKILHK